MKIGTSLICYTLFCLFTSLSVYGILEAYQRRMVVTFLSLPLLLLFGYFTLKNSVANKEDKLQIWFLSRLARLIITVAVLIVVLTDILLSFIAFVTAVYFRRNI